MYVQKILLPSLVQVAVSTTSIVGVVLAKAELHKHLVRCEWFFPRTGQIGIMSLRGLGIYWESIQDWPERASRQTGAFGCLAHYGYLFGSTR
jgi:hypothetical protein